jgi:CubicO group peptidase (beta-lactamase class C family)
MEAGDDVLWAEPASIAAYVAAQYESMRLPALAVVAVAEGEVLYEGVFGSATPGGAAISLDTPFSLGSTSKQFTGLVIQQLIADGRLTLDDTVAGILPDLSGTPYDDVTVAQLLTHHSGISYPVGLMQWRPWLDEVTVRDHARLMLNTSPAVEPGSAHEYSNGNYTVLGAIVEQVTDDPYPTALRKLVTQPLGLTGTTADLTEAQSYELASWNYPWFEFITVPTPQPAYEASAPSAFVHASARDLERLLLAHLDSVTTQIPVEVLAAAREPLAQESEYSEYASGWSVRPFWELRDYDENWDDGTLPPLWEHQGTTLRSFSYLAMQPELGFGVVILANSGAAMDQGQVYSLAYGLSHHIAGTAASPVVTPPLVAAAPVLIIALPVLLVGVIFWLARGLRHSRQSRIGRAAPLVAATLVVAASLALCLGVVPAETGTPLLDPSWWSAVPDLAISTALMLLLSAVTAGIAAAVLIRWTGKAKRPNVVRGGSVVGTPRDHARPPLV